MNQAVLTMTTKLSLLGNGDIIQVLQTALTPAFLLVGLGAMLQLFAGRLARIVDRSRDLQAEFGSTEGEAHQLVVDELRDLQKRIHIVNSAIFLASSSAATVCVLIGLLFFMATSSLPLADVVAGAFILAMGLMALALVQFIREVRIAIADIMIREAFLEIEDKTRT